MFPIFPFILPPQPPLTVPLLHGVPTCQGVSGFTPNNGQLHLFEFHPNQEEVDLAHYDITEVVSASVGGSKQCAWGGWIGEWVDEMDGWMDDGWMDSQLRWRWKNENKTG